jgi:hypothetical protein
MPAAGETRRPVFCAYLDHSFGHDHFRFKRVFIGVHATLPQAE